MPSMAAKIITAMVMPILMNTFFSCPYNVHAFIIISQAYIYQDILPSFDYTDANLQKIKDFIK